MISIGTKTSLKLLEILFEEPLHEFKEIELIKKAKTGKGSASNLINELIKENILIEKRVGKTKTISLNLHSRSVFLLKNLFDEKKILNLLGTKLASVILFRNQVKEYTKLIMVFGSTIARTSTEKSDIDLLLVYNHANKVMKIREEIEELFGERFNLHLYTRNEIKKKVKTDSFTRNTLLKGVIIYGYELGKDLFSIIKGEEDLKRLFFFNERIKSALKNYLNKDYKTAEEIIERTIEQLIFYLLSEKGISYTSKEDAKRFIKKISEGKTINKIYKVSLKEKIILTERLVMSILKNKIVESEGYAKPRN